MTRANRRPKDILPHVRYEISQLASACSVRVPPDAPLPDFPRNLIIECILLHVRALLPFFERPATSRPKNDVLAADLGFAPAALPIDPGVRERIDKDLAHLTWARAERKPIDCQWNLGQIATPVLERALELIEHVLKGGAGELDGAGKADWETLRDQVRQCLGTTASFTGAPAPR